MTKASLSHLPGNHRTRVFVGGSYDKEKRGILGLIKESVKSAGFYPVLADEFELLAPDRDIHDVTLWLLHACRLAIFEVSAHSGALMELERMRDYGIYNALLLYYQKDEQDWRKYPDAWKSTQMLKSLALELGTQCVVRPYVRPRNAATATTEFLRAIKRSSYGKVHRLR